MAFIIKDRVKEATTSTGTGAVSLGGAAATFDTFQSYMTNGDTTYYAIVHTTSGTDEWEVGLGTWNTGNTITRTTVLAGSNGTSAVNFSAGTKDVFMTYPAAHAALAGDDVTFANITVTGTVDGRDVAADGTKLDTVETNADVTDAVNVAAAGALMKSGGTMTGNLILNADPTTALGAATKEYVDTIAAAGIHYHTPVRVETPSALNATYDNGSSGVGATLTNAGTQAALVIDGVTVATNDRVLVYNQTNAAHNGIYTVTNTGSASTNWVLTRATDADSYGASDPNAMGEGDAYFVKEGDTGAGELYVMNTSGTITFGTTDITFTVIAETAVYSAGTGMSLNGTTFSIGQDVGTTANVTFNQVTAAIIGNVTGNLTGDVTGNADTATALETARTIQLSGDVTGSATFDGTANINITAAVQDDSHAHVISNVDGLQAALDAKADDTTTITAGNGLTGGGSIGANRTLNVGAGSGISVTADAVAHADTSTQASVNNSGNTFIQDVTLDGFGHVTGLTSGSVSVGDATITIAAGGGLQTGGDFTTNQSTNETITLAHADTSSQASVNNSGGNVIQDITLDGYGHITSVGSVNLDGRYYTESEADNRFLRGDTSDTMSGNLTVTGNIKARNGDDSDVIIGEHPSYTSYGAVWLDGESDYRLLMDGGSHTFLNAIGSGHIYFRNDNGTLVEIPDTGGLLIGGNTAFHDGYHPNADKWTTARTLSLSGDASGSVSWDGSANATLSVTVANDSHNHNHSDGGFTVNGTVQATGGANIVSTSSNPFRWQRSGLSQTGQDDNVTVHVDDSNIYFTHNNDADGDASGFHFRRMTGGSAQTLLSFNSGTISYKGQNIFRDDYHPNADKWTTARTLSLSGDASGSVSWDGSANATLSVTVANDSHNHNHSDGGFTVNGFLENTGGAKIEVQNTQNGGTGKGIYMWSSSDTNWVHYMSEAGSGRAADGGTATASIDGRTSHHIRYRVAGGSNNGFLWENNSDQALMSLGGDNGSLYVRGQMYAGNSTSNTVWHAGNDGSGSGLDADKLDGLQLTSQNRNNQANRVVRTQGNGYCEFGWINTTSGDTTSSLSRIYVDTGDGYIRKSTLAHVASQLPIQAGANNDIFWENGQNVTSNYTITNGKNAMSAGPITVNNGVTVTVGSGETWTVV